MRRIAFIALAIAVAGLLLWRSPRRIHRQPPAPLSVPAIAQQKFEISPAGAKEGSREQGNVLFRVTDATGAALADVPVCVWMRGPYDPAESRLRWTTLTEARTGKDGIARAALKAGSYYAAAHAPGLAPARALLTVKDQLEVRLMARTPVSLAGSVQDAVTHEPIALADLRLIPEMEELGNGEPPAEERSHVASRADGHFVASGLASGTYVIEAQAAGYGRTHTPELSVPHGDMLVVLRAAAFVEGRVLLPDGRAAARAEVTASNREEPAVAEADSSGHFSLQVEPGPLLLSARSGELSVRLTKPLTVRAGATMNAGDLRLHQGGTIDAEVFGSGFARIANAEVILSPYGWRGTTSSGKTGPDGRVRIKGLPEGSYDLDVLAEGYGRYIKRGIVLAAGQTIPYTVMLQGDGAVAGTVRDGAGNPVEGAFIRAQTPGVVFDPDPLTTRTDVSGHYRLDGLPAERAYIAALPSERAATGDAKEVFIHSGETVPLDLVLEASATITGHVDRAERGRVRVFARRAEPLRSDLDLAESALDPDGRYSLKVPSGRWQVYPALSGQTGGGREPAHTVEVKPGQTLQLDLAVDDGNDAVTGQVLEPDGAPSAGATLLLLRPTGLPEAWRADDDGRFKVARARDLPEATRILARNGGRHAEPTVGQGELIIRLRAAAAIHGRVTSAGRPAAEFQLSIASLDAPQWGQSNYEISGGSFMLDDVPAGRLLLTFTLHDGTSNSHEVTLQEGEDRELLFEVVAAARVRGRIVDRAQAPQSGVFVRAFPNGEGTGNGTMTDARGTFSIPLPARGAVVVAAFSRKSRVIRNARIEQDELDLGDLMLEEVDLAHEANPGAE